MTYMVRQFHWTTVEVRGDDGILQLGRVTDCASEGLMVDFMCGTGVQLVPFGQIYHSDLYLYKYRHAIVESEDQPVEALIRRSSGEPAKWYPGILLMGDFGYSWAFGLVRATTSSGTLVEIVHADYIRDRSSEDKLTAKSKLLVGKGEFVKAQMHLPSGVSSGLPSPSPYETAPVDQHLVDRFNKNSSHELIVATHIDGGVLHVLKAIDRSRQSFNRDYPNRYYPEFEGEKLLRMLRVTCEALTEANVTPQKRSSEEEHQASALKKMSKDVPLEASMQCSASIIDQTSDFPPINGILPRELLAEIFSILDGAVQAKIGGVCSRWNCILNSVPCGVLRLLEEKNSVIPGVCLLKRWTTQVKIIVNTGLENRRSRWKDKPCYASLVCTGRLFRSIMQEHHLSRLEKLILANISWRWSAATLAADYFGNFVSYLCQELNLFASVCRSLVLKDVTVKLSGYMHRPFVSDTFGLKLIVHITKGRIEGGLPVVTLWNRMDSSLPLLTDADVDRLKESIADSEDSELPEELVEILNGCQSADPCSGNQFSGKKWSRDHLDDLDLKKLNRITLHSLLKTCCDEKLVIVLEW